MTSETGEHKRLDSLFDELFPICRSITGPGLRESLEILSDHVPLDIESVPTGSQVFDWTVPAEWRIRDAHLVGPDGETYADFQRTNLSVVNYSKPVDRSLTLEELDAHLYTDPDNPEAIPYVTSYYDRTWGFCLPHQVYEELPAGEYHAYIDSEFVDGSLEYGHAVLPGESDEEVLLSSYICHPSLANNELSGPLVLTSVYRRLKEREDRRYTYRFVLCPETIGSIAYLNEHGDELKENLAGGLVLTCLGGPAESLSYKTSRRESALIDETVRNLRTYGDVDVDIRQYTPTSGSDERQYCSPGFDLPVGQIARTVYGQYDGYHNSLDDKAFMGIRRLISSADTIERILRSFEYGGYYENEHPYGEPMLGKRDLYPSVNSPDQRNESGAVVDEGQILNQIRYVLSYSDGEHSMVEIADQCTTSLDELAPTIDTLEKHDLLTRLRGTDSH